MGLEASTRDALASAFPSLYHFLSAPSLSSPHLGSLPSDEQAHALTALFQ